MGDGVRTRAQEVPLTPEEGSPEVGGDPEPDKGRSRRGWWWVVAGGCVVVLVFVFWVVQGGVLMSDRVKDTRKLSHEEAVAFVERHKDAIVASDRKVFATEIEHGYLTIDGVEVVAESVKESEYGSNPMTWSKGLISYNYYINGNRDYEVIGDSMIGPYYEGNLMEDASDPWKPGKVYGDGATYSARFNEIMHSWEEEVNRPRLEADARERERQLEFARQRYKDDREVPEVESVVIDPVPSLNGQLPEGVFVFDFLINGDERFKVYDCGIVAPGYPGVLRKRNDDGLLLWMVQEGDDGSSLRAGDIVDFFIDEQWRPGY